MNKNSVEDLGSSISSTASQHDLDMAAVYAEALKAVREADGGMSGRGSVIDISKMMLLLKAAKHLLLAASGRDDGPTSWTETRRRWMDEYNKGCMCESGLYRDSTCPTHGLEQDENWKP